MDKREFQASMNMSYMIGYYQGLLKGILEEIQDGNKDYVMGEFMIMRIESALFHCGKIWESRYDKTHDEILAELDNQNK